MELSTRCAALLSSVSELEAHPAPQTAVTATLRITSGLHRGASMHLTADEYVLGCADDCDIVLRDTGRLIGPSQ